MTVIEQIQDKYPFLTRKQREVVDYMLEDAERMSYVTLKEMGQDTGITEMTILKTCSLLGFSSFSSMKYEFRKYVAQQLELFRHRSNEYSTPPAPAYELSNTHRLFQEICGEEAKLFRLLFQELDIDRLFAAADMIMAAERIVLCGRGVSANICGYFSTCLSVLGRGVININSELDDSIHAALPQLTENTLLIAVSYPDYYRMTTKVTEYAHHKGIRILGLTDTEKSPIVPFCELVLTAPTQTRMFLNTIGPPMTLVNLVTTALHIRLSEQEGDFAESITEFYTLFPER